MKDFTHLEPETLVSALKVAHLGVWEWDIVNESLSWSTELKEMYGLDVNEKVTYEKYLSLVHPDDRQKTTDIIADALRTRKKYSIEHRVVWPDGSVHWIRGHGRAFFKNDTPVRMLGTAFNIDARKKAEKELEESEMRFRYMADSAPVLIWMSDTTKDFTYFNKPWLEYRGKSLNTELGKGWLRGIHPEDRPRLIHLYESSFDKHKKFSIEFRLKDKNGDYRWILSNGAPRYTDNLFMGFIGSCTDIDDVKTIVRHSDELESINMQLEAQYDELLLLNQTKDEFISLASHQLRTPATGVKQYLGMLIDGFAGDLSDDQRSLLETAYTSNERQLSIIDDLLRVAHIDSGKVILNISSIEIVRLIKDIVKEQSSKFTSRHQTVKIIHTKEKVFAHIDAGRFRMAIENIIDNASKYSPQKTNITISVKQTQKNLIISVQDQGVGIADGDIHKVFKKFSRISNPLSMKVGGTGLGLYWALRVIELHGGTIRINSELDKGSVFSIYVPK